MAKMPAITPPSPRLAPVTRATRRVALMWHPSPPEEMLNARYRVQLQVHLKSSGKCCKLGSVGEALTIGEVAKRSGVATSALRFYEEQGLIHAERPIGHRRYLPQ